MFDVERTGCEIEQFYRHIVEGAVTPTAFSAEMALDEMKAGER
jgi:hypothetical protein